MGAALVLSLLVNQVNSVCQEDAQCPGDQGCLVETTVLQNTARIVNQDKDFKVEILPRGVCGCPVNYIIWKWRCLPLVQNIGDQCVVGHQCPKDLYCDPLSRTCECSIHKVNCEEDTTTSRTTTLKVSASKITGKIMSSGIVITDDDMEKIPHHHKEIFKTLIANMNKTFHETLNQTRGRNPEQSQELDSWTSSQVNTMVFIGLACLALVVIAIVGTAYLRSISEKRRSAAAIKSLLDMMAENRSINSTVYTMEPGVYAASTATSYQPPHQNTQNTDMTNSDKIPGLKPDFNPSQALEDRIKLDPIDEQPKMPSPHLSAPVLPPICKRPRPVSQKNVEELPNSSSVAAITHNLNMHTVHSAASFPNEEE